MANKPVSNSVLGQIRDDVVGELVNIPKDAGKTVASQPKQILDAILGQAKPDTKNSGDTDETGIEDIPTASNTGDSVQQAKQQQLLMKKTYRRQAAVGKTARITSAAVAGRNPVCP